jgi:hypothetical protein
MKTSNFCDESRSSSFLLLSMQTISFVAELEKAIGSGLNASALGWFVDLAYYRSSLPVKWAITLAPLVLLGLLIDVNISTGGAVLRAIWDYVLLSLGLANENDNPYTAVLSLLAYSTILYGPVYLLIRRAPEKE